MIKEDFTIKCEVIQDFTLKKFDDLKNIVRKNANKHGWLYIGDTFECDKDMTDYLMGNNDKNETVIKIVEVEPIRKNKKNRSGENGKK